MKRELVSKTEFGETEVGEIEVGETEVSERDSAKRQAELKLIYESGFGETRINGETGTANYKSAIWKFAKRNSVKRYSAKLEIIGEMGISAKLNRRYVYGRNVI